MKPFLILFEYDEQEGFRIFSDYNSFEEAELAAIEARTDNHFLRMMIVENLKTNTSPIYEYT